MRESHIRGEVLKKEHEDQNYQTVLQVQKVLEEQAAHVAERARTIIDEQAALAQADVLRASQLVINAEQAAEKAAQQAAQTRASAEARFAEVSAEADNHVRTANATADGAQSAIR